MPDLSLDPDPHRNLKLGPQRYQNCLGFALNKKVKSTKFTDACSASFCGFAGLADINLIMQKVFAKLAIDGLRWRVVGTSRRIPTQHAPSISRRELIGVGQELDSIGSVNRDLHFYVVTQSNGDGQGLCGNVDAKTNNVKPCRLRNELLIQHSGTGPPQNYLLLGFIVVEQ